MMATSFTMPGLIRQFVTFCGVGVINTVVGLAVILFLSEILSLHYGIANLTGYGVGLLIGFVLHRNVTFCETSGTRSTRSQLAFFLLIFVIAYLIQLAALIVMVKIFGWPNLFSQIAAVGIYTVISFAGNRLLTFKDNPAEGQR